MIRKSIAITLLLTTVLGLFSQCNGLDCPLDNTVVCTYGLYDKESKQPLTLANTDTLTIMVANRDTILLNRANGIKSLSLPLSYQQAADTLIFRFSNNEGQVAFDTLIYHKHNFSHFEDISCPAAVFHRLTTVQVSPQLKQNRPLLLDSAVITRATINYDDIENIQLYLRRY